MRSSVEEEAMAKRKTWREKLEAEQKCKVVDNPRG